MPNRPAVPSPVAPAPPAEALDPAGVHAAPAWISLPLSDNLDAAIVQPAAVHGRASAPLRGTSSPPADLARSLVYSGALALGIAGSGLLLVGFRRQLW